MQGIADRRDRSRREDRKSLRVRFAVCVRPAYVRVEWTWAGAGSRRRGGARGGCRTRPSGQVGSSGRAGEGARGADPAMRSGR